MGGKQNREQRVYINNAIREDLMWALTHLKGSDGVHLFKSISWTPSLALPSTATPVWKGWVSGIQSPKTVTTPLPLLAHRLTPYFILRPFAFSQPLTMFKPRLCEDLEYYYTLIMQIPLTFSAHSDASLHIILC